MSDIEKPTTDFNKSDDELARSVPPDTAIAVGIELEDPEAWPEALELTKLGIARAKLEADLRLLREQTALLRETLRVIGYRGRVIVNDEKTYLDSSARAQLGEYPWAKLAVAVCATYIATRLARRSLR
jgi:hypothetical protein